MLVVPSVRMSKAAVAEAAAPNFVHAERIGPSARLHDWEIAAHRHDHLTQALMVTEGGGQVRIDAGNDRFRAPWLLWIPAGTVHAFSFRPETEGVVLSLSDDFLGSVITHDHEAARLDATAAAVFSGPPGAPDEIDMNVVSLFEGLRREVGGAQPGSFSAVAALVKLLLVGVVRTHALRAFTEPAAAARAGLYRRFRRLLEANLRQNWPVARFAADLGVSPDRLHAACTQVVGKPPQSVLHERQMLEAQRALIYTALPISKIAFDLGFNDPAYFSRFFAQRAGISPAAYRKRNRPADPSARGAPPLRVR